jgi:surface protein
MDQMFNECESFNQPLNKWNVSSVESMQYMFHRCTSFNQDISNWDVSNVSPFYQFAKCPIEQKFKPKFK